MARKAVWLTHRRELAAQTEGMLQEDHVSATKDIQWTPGTKAPSIPNGVVVLMAQTVSRRTANAEVWDSYNGHDLMVIDEAHHATAEGWARAMKQWPGPALGMTATPWRLSQKEGFDHLFEKLTCGPQVAELQSDGWLCNARVLSPPEGELIQGGQRLTARVSTPSRALRRPTGTATSGPRALCDSGRRTERYDKHWSTQYP